MLLQKFLLAFALISVGHVSADVWENAEQYHKDFTETLRSSIEAADQKHDEVVAKLTETLTGTLIAAEEELQVVIQYMAKEVEGIRSLATPENEELYEHCIGLYSDEMRRVPEYVREVITECVEELKNSTTTDVEDSRTQVQNYIYVSDETWRDIEACRLVTDSEECISRVVIEILLLTLEIPTNISEQTLRTVDLAELYIQEIPLCSPDRINGANVMSGVIIGYIKSCAGIPRS